MQFYFKPFGLKKQKNILINFAIAHWLNLGVACNTTRKPSFLDVGPCFLASATPTGPVPKDAGWLVQAVELLAMREEADLAAVRSVCANLVIEFAAQRIHRSRDV